MVFASGMLMILPGLSGPHWRPYLCPYN